MAYIFTILVMFAAPTAAYSPPLTSCPHSIPWRNDSGGCVKCQVVSGEAKVVTANERECVKDKSDCGDVCWYNSVGFCVKCGIVDGVKTTVTCHTCPPKPKPHQYKNPVPAPDPAPRRWGSPALKCDCAYCKKACAPSGANLNCYCVEPDCNQRPCTVCTFFDIKAKFGIQGKPCKPGQQCGDVICRAAP